MPRTLELKGVIHGKTITLEEATFLPDGCPVVVQLSLSHEEALHQLALPCEPMTPEELVDLEEDLSEFHDRPIQLPPTDVS
jgi:hypothetical protein